MMRQLKRRHYTGSSVGLGLWFPVQPTVRPAEPPSVMSPARPLARAVRKHTENLRTVFRCQL